MTEMPLPAPKIRRPLKPWVYTILLLYVLAIGAYFRLVGSNWGEYQYLHPDERFLVWVGSDISPVKVEAAPDGGEPRKVWLSLSEYFDTQNSPLNPHNRGHGFYVYGTLPMFITRAAVELLFGKSGFKEMSDVGRPLSALADLLSVFLVYLTAARLYDRRVGVLAAAFAAGAVMQIQQSHFFTMDTFINCFSLLALYFAVRISMENGTEGASLEAPLAIGQPEWWREFIHHPYFLLSLGFGLALGMAVASKLNAALMAVTLPVAMLLRLLVIPRHLPEKREQWLLRAFGYLVLAAVVSLLTFRIFQPYAFSGPSFFDVKLNPKWVENIKSLQAQTGGDVDFPPALQWANRPVWFAGKNMVLWGLGLPLGILAWTGFLYAGWRILKGDWRRHILIWIWTAVYFGWQSMTFNPTMRYQLPVYPTLVIFAAWAVFALFDARRKALSGSQRTVAAIVLGVGVLLGTYAWAFAFTRIYTRPITRVEATRWIYENVPAPINLSVETSDGKHNEMVAYPYDYIIRANAPYLTTFTARYSGTVKEITLAHVLDWYAGRGLKTLAVTLSATRQAETPATGTTESYLKAGSDGKGEGYLLNLDRPFMLQKGETYQVMVSLQSGEGAVTLEGASIANEGEWDDGLPLRMEGYDPFGGLYPRDLNFNMYWDDNTQKLERFLKILDSSEYILFTSNRQWGTLPRLPKRFPLSTLYYRSLLGCPEEKTIEWCYSVAKPGMFNGSLGFELEKTFQSDPNIGPWAINDQFAEEAFTVYDHPKVFVFRKTDRYDAARARQILSQVDFSLIVRTTPKKAGSFPADLLLPAERLAEQQQGGAWSDYFNPQAWPNRFQPLGVLLWYLSVTILGLAVYPLLRLLLPGLQDHGYPLARTAGLLILSYLVWLAGSYRIPFTRPTISVVLLILALLGGFLAYRQRQELRQEWRERCGYYLLVEVLFLGFFLLFLFVRLGNPDLWHPWKGGERPMDFSYFNAVLKSTSFPPYDPWFAGGYLNYYYYGFVYVGVLVKWLGIVPSFAFNLILPTLFSLTAMGAFSAAWNLSHSLSASPTPANEGEEASSDGLWKRLKRSAFTPQVIPAIAAALLMVVLGNLGTLRMIFRGYQALINPELMNDGAGLLTRWSATIQGLGKALSGVPLPYGIGDWYWNPSRMMPPGDLAITEFPAFTFIYSDPHAHMYALSIALLALSWIISVALGRPGWKSPWVALGSLALGGLAIGALRPTNTWDMPTYLALAVVALLYAIVRYFPTDAQTYDKHKLFGFMRALPLAFQKMLAAFTAVAALVGFAFLMFQPFSQWYGQGYTSAEIWKDPLTPLNSYFDHWGLFLFVLVSWMAWETVDWMAKTPLSSLRKLAPYQEVIWGLVGMLFLTIAVLVVKLPGPEGNPEGASKFAPLGNGIVVALVALPLAAWAGTLLLRPGMSDAKRAVLFIVGTGMVITLFVEMVVLRGDIGRQNTVFKLYLQVWTLFSVCAGATLGWLLKEMHRWSSRPRLAWQALLVILVAAAALFPLLGGMFKIKDRMVSTAPHTLDGMTYMAYATYDWLNTSMDLNQDYQAIRWMQENIQGSPVIVEANSRDLYRWYSRFTIYTGLPGVVGWDWHQQQQRGFASGDWISKRVQEINDFYNTSDLELARAFLQRYNVRYIIVGQLEWATYSDVGLQKFPGYDGLLWQEIYKDRDTVIYEVINQ